MQRCGTTNYAGRCTFNNHDNTEAHTWSLPWSGGITFLPQHGMGDRTLLCIAPYPYLPPEDDAPR